jgi:hypothetical protein
MKKLVCAISLLLVSIISYSQTSDSIQTYNAPTPPLQPVVPKKPMPVNVLRINFFGMFGGSFNGEFERVINDRFSAQIAVGYRYSNLDILNVIGDSLYPADQVDHTQQGYTVVPQIKFYWTHFSKKLKVPTGSYIAPFFRYGSYDMKFVDGYSNLYDVTYKRTAIGGGILVGFQLLAGRTFAIDVFAGPQIKYIKHTDILYKTKSYNQVDPFDLKQTQITPGLRAGISLGFGF